MELSNWDYVFCPCPLEQLNPSIRVPFFSLEERNEILIAELHVGTVILKVVGVFRSVLDIHEVRIPLASKGRN